MSRLQELDAGHYCCIVTSASNCAVNASWHGQTVVLYYILVRLGNKQSDILFFMRFSYGLVGIRFYTVESVIVLSVKLHKH